MTKTSIYYLDILPGVGKTTWAISEMASRMQNKEVITLYVGPTLELLKQVRKDLIKVARSHVKEPENLIHLVKSSTDLGDKNVWIPVAEQLRLFLQGGTPLFGKGPHVQKAALGSVIFLTHAAFLKRQSIDKTNVCVIFDEARKFVTQLEEIKLKDKDEETWLRKILKDGTTQMFDASGKGTEFYKVTLDKMPKNLNSKIKSTDSRLQYGAIHAIANIVRNPDIDLYVSYEKTKSSTRIKFKFHQVIVPSNIFVGFPEVVLMSAFLKDSQMWHLLSTNPTVTLSDIRKVGPYRIAINKLIYNRAESIASKFELIKIIPLTVQRGLVSLNRYDKGILVPEHAELLLKLELEELGFKKTKDVLNLMKDHGNLVLNRQQEKVLAVVDKYRALPSVLHWYCDTAIKVVANIRRWGKLRKAPLVMANKKLGIEDTIRREYLQFQIIPIQSHGRNDFKEHNCIFFAAAINPDKHSKQLYAALLPKYDIAVDFVADICVQAVTRLSVRDTQASNPVYVIVPDLAVANLLYLKLGMLPSIDTTVANKYGLTSFNHLNADRVAKKPRVKRTAKEKAQAEIDKHSKWREGNRELASKRATRSRLRKQLQNTIDRDTRTRITAKLAKIETEIKSLRSKQKL